MKRTSKIISLVLAVMVLCGSAGTALAAAMGAGKTVIRFENHGANKHELFSLAVQIFNESQDEVYVDFQTNTTDWEASFWAALAVNDAPDIVTHIAQARIAQYADAGHLLDLSGLACAGFIADEAKPAVSYKDGLYAIPVQTEIYGVFYNKDLFAQAGITALPATITEFEQTLEKLKSLEPQNVYPIVAQYRDPGQLGFWGLYGAAGSLYQSVSEQGIDKAAVAKGEYKFDNPRFRNIMRVYELVRQYAQPRAEDTDYTTHNTMFAGGEAAMLIMGNWMISQMRELNPDINVGMFPLPVSEDPADAMFAEDYNLVINVNAHTQHKEAVDKFLAFFCDYTKPTKEFFIKNALPSGLKDFEKVVTYDASLEAPLAAAQTSEYFTRVMPTGFDLGKCLQEYMMDKSMTIDQAVKLIQNDYDQHVASMK